MEFYKKRGRWCVRDDNGKLHKFTRKTEATAFVDNLKMPTVEHDESDAIEEEKSIADKMKKAATAVTLDDLQGSYE
jgi:hypothetical protein